MFPQTAHSGRPLVAPISVVNAIIALHCERHMTLPPRLAELERYLDETRAELLALVETIPHETLVQPREGCWTGAQIIDHLRVVEGSIVRVCNKLLRGAPARDARIELPDSGSLMHQLDRFRIAEGGRRIEAPEFVRPAGNPDPVESLAALEESRQALKTVLRASESVMVDFATFPHQLLGPLTFHQWILFVGQHERRHANQLRQLANAQAGQGTMRAD